jgi:hypothetical protein
MIHIEDLSSETGVGFTLSLLCADLHTDPLRTSARLLAYEFGLMDFCGSREEPELEEALQYLWYLAHFISKNQ